jgi:aldehyde:ferredoxin oxidoreductase
MFGWQGKALRINLSNELIKTEVISEELLERSLGGSLLAKEIVEAEGISAQNNKLVLANGALTGTGVPAAAFSNMGAYVSGDERVKFFPLYFHFGAELRFCGYDVLIIEGVASAWSYLLILDNEIKIVPAEEIKGLSPLETEKAIRSLYSKWYGDEIRILSIGEAAEDQSALSGLVTDGLLIPCSGEFGGVFAEKRLKGVALRGVFDLKLAQPARFVRIITDTIGSFKENRDKFYPIMQKLFEDLNLVPLEVYKRAEKRGCLGCPIACLRQKEDKLLPDFTTLFSLAGLVGFYKIKDIMAIYELCLKMGIDPVSLSLSASCLIELGKKGKIDGPILRARDKEGLINLMEDKTSLLHKGAFALAKEYEIDDFLIDTGKKLNDNLASIFSQIEGVDEKLNLLDALGICPYALLVFPYEMVKNSFNAVTGKKLDGVTLANRR